MLKVPGCILLALLPIALAYLVLDLAEPWTSRYLSRAPVSTEAEHRQCLSNLEAIAGALESYKASLGSYPRNQYQLMPEYLERLPICPTARRVTYRTNFGAEGFEVWCAGGNHLAQSDSVVYP